MQRPPSANYHFVGSHGNNYDRYFHRAHYVCSSAADTFRNMRDNNTRVQYSPSGLLACPLCFDEKAFNQKRQRRPDDDKTEATIQKLVCQVEQLSKQLDHHKELLMQLLDHHTDNRVQKHGVLREEKRRRKK